MQSEEYTLSWYTCRRGQDRDSQPRAPEAEPPGLQPGLPAVKLALDITSKPDVPKGTFQADRNVLKLDSGSTLFQ